VGFLTAGLITGFLVADFLLVVALVAGFLVAGFLVADALVAGFLVAAALVAGFLVPMVVFVFAPAAGFATLTGAVAFFGVAFCAAATPFAGFFCIPPAGAGFLAGSFAFDWGFLRAAAFAASLELMKGLPLSGLPRRAPFCDLALRIELIGKRLSKRLQRTCL
jgi:hypothetical protein